MVRSTQTFPRCTKVARKDGLDELLAARGVYGLFPANSVGDDVELYTDESRNQLLTTFHFLRQQIEKETTTELLPG
jgi:5-methyltetrahydrofolate--homocysteine methyltransferase